MGNIQHFIIPGIIIAVVSYLLGSISFSIIFTKIFMKDDIRNFGSGNAGATNVLRTAGKKPAILTLLFDFLKGIVSVLIAQIVFTSILEDLAIPLVFVSVAKIFAGFCCILGHIFPIYFNFRGGKAVATAGAMIAVVDYRAFIIVLATFIIVTYFTKIVSLASISAAISFPISLFVFNVFFTSSVQVLEASQSNLYVFIMTFMASLIAFIVVFKHKENIARIIKGEEKKITSK